MTSASTNLSLPYLAPGQAQKHVTVNEGLQRLDALVQLSVVSATTTAEPGSPSDGAVYIVPSGKSGTHWASFANWALAYYRDGAWEEITPREGWLAWAKDTDLIYVHTGSAWAAKVPLLDKANAFTTGPQTISFGTTGASLITLVNTDAGSFGAAFDCYHNSASPAANDAFGYLTFGHNNFSGVRVNSTSFRSTVTNVTTGAESATLDLRVRQGGAVQHHARPFQRGGVCWSGAAFCR